MKIHLRGYLYLVLFSSFLIRKNPFSNAYNTLYMEATKGIFGQNENENWAIDRINS